jgi:ribosomal protein L28
VLGLLLEEALRLIDKVGIEQVVADLRARGAL